MRTRWAATALTFFFALAVLVNMITLSSSAASSFAFLDQEIEETLAYMQQVDGFEDFAAALSAIDGKPVPSSYVTMARERAREADKLSITDLSKLIVGATAAKLNVADIDGVDLVRTLASKSSENLGTIYDVTWVLIAYDSGEHNVPEDAAITRKVLVDKLLEAELDGGGWSWGDVLDPDTTGMVMTALSTHRDRPAVAAALNRAAVALQGVAVDNSNSASQLVVGLSAAGVDPTDVAYNQVGGQNLIDYIYSFKDTEGNGYHWQPDYPPNEYATNDVAFAYRAYKKSFIQHQKGSVYHKIGPAGVPSGADNPGDGDGDENNGDDQGDGQNDDEDDSDDNDSDDPGNSNPGSGGSNNPSPGDDENSNPEALHVRVEVLVDVDVAGFPIENESVALEPGATVFDALAAVVGESNIVWTGSGSTLYVRAVKGLKEKEYGPMSGWVFMVNGQEIFQGAGVYRLEDGDTVTWHYTNVDPSLRKEADGSAANDPEAVGAQGNERLRLGPTDRLDRELVNRILARFQDAQEVSDYSRNYFAKAEQLGFVQGKPTPGKPETYLLDPKGTASRAEIIKILTTMAFGEFTVKERSSVSDLSSDAWYFPYFVKAIDEGLVQGRPDGRYDPTQSITRYELALLLARLLDRYADTPVGGNGEDDESVVRFRDVDDNHPGSSAVYRLARAGIMIGYDGLFHADQPVTREMAVVAAMRLYELFIEQSLEARQEGGD